MVLQVDLSKHVFQDDNIIIPAGSVFPAVATPALGYSNLNTKAGMHHCPLKFIEIYDPKKPILFQDITLSGVYSRFRPGSNVRLNAQDEPME